MLFYSQLFLKQECSGQISNTEYQVLSDRLHNTDSRFIDRRNFNFGDGLSFNSSVTSLNVNPGQTGERRSCLDDHYYDITVVEPPCLKSDLYVQRFFDVLRHRAF